MSVSVVQASAGDAKIISELATKTFYETYDWYNTPENMRDYTSTYFGLERTLSELNEPNTYFFLAYHNNEAVGYAKMRNVEHPRELARKKYLEVERIYVRKNLQDKKIGYQLINACIQKARELNLDCIWLGVWEKNTKAAAFYEKIGFQKFGRHVFTLGNDAQEDYLLKFDL